MKNLIFAALCITIVSAQYHGNRGYSSGGYAGHQSNSGSMSGGYHHSGRSLVSQGYSAVGAARTSAGPANSGSHCYSGSYGQSGHRIGRSVGVMPSIGHVAITPVFVNAGHSGHRMGRSVSILPVVDHSGVGPMYGGYTQGGHYGGHRYARSVFGIAPVVAHGSYSGLALTTGHYGSVAGHGHRMVRSPVGVYRGAVAGHSRGSYGGYSNVGHQQSSMGARWGVE